MNEFDLMLMILAITLIFGMFIIPFIYLLIVKPWLDVIPVKFVSKYGIRFSWKEWFKRGCH